MRTPNYLASLLPSFATETVLEDCRITRGEIKDITLPAYHAAVPLLKGWKYKTDAIVADMGQFRRIIKGNDDFVVAVEKSFKTILENLDIVEDMVTKTFNQEVAGSGVTYLKSNLLQFVECVAFVSKYARKYLIYIYVMETSHFTDSNTTVAESLTPAEIEWLRANFVSFCTALNVTSTAPMSVRKAIADIPDIVVTADNAQTLGSTMGENKIDPFQMRLIPVWLNPIYHVGMFVAEWQSSRYKAAQEELKLIQLRKLNLERLSQGKPDAKLQKEISYMESRIQGLNYKLAKMEKDNA